MEQLTDNQAAQVLNDSLVEVLPKVVRQVGEEFCGDCPKRQANCFPCKSAITMLNVYLAALLAEQSRLN